MKPTPNKHPNNDDHLPASDCEISLSSIFLKPTNKSVLERYIVKNKRSTPEACKAKNKRSKTK